MRRTTAVIRCWRFSSMSLIQTKWHVGRALQIAGARVRSYRRIGRDDHRPPPSPTAASDDNGHTCRAPVGTRPPSNRIYAAIAKTGPGHTGTGADTRRRDDMGRRSGSARCNFSTDGAGALRCGGKAGRGKVRSIKGRSVRCVRNPPAFRRLCLLVVFDVNYRRVAASCPHFLTIFTVRLSVVERP